MWRTENFTDLSSCEQYDGCHLDDTVSVGEVCLGEQCVWRQNSCYCSKIIDPFSPTDGCDACKYETLIVEWFSDVNCSESLDEVEVIKDTCYYSCGNPLSEMPTPSPTEQPTTSSPTEQPTPNPTMTNSPTLSPIVISEEICDLEFLRDELNDTFYDIGDLQWIDDCLDLYTTKTDQIPIVCGCLGKFTKSMANQYLNCILQEPYHGLTVWSMCINSIYAESCGSRCTETLTRRQFQQEISHR